MALESANTIGFKAFANVRLQVFPIFSCVFQRRVLVLQGVDEPF